MKKILTGLLFLLSLTHAIEIDVPFVKSQADANAHDIDNRLLLVKYYFQNHDYAEAQTYVDQILALKAQHTLANKVNRQLELMRVLEKTSTLKNAPASESLQKIFKKREYGTFITLYEKAESLGLSFDEKMDLNVATAYFEMGKLDKSSAFLTEHTTLKDKKSQTLKKKIALAQAEQNIQTNKNPEALNDYIYLLNQDKNPQKALKELKKFVKSHPQNVDAKITLAENYYWQKETKKAFHTLYSVRKHSHKSKKLYANILYDMADYKHALYYLPGVSAHEKSQKEKYTLEKRTAFAYMHIGEKAKAERLIQKLLRQNPKDKELVSYRDNVEKERLLSHATSYHKAKEYAKALNYYQHYHDKTHDPKIAKEIAEIYYFNKKEKLALPYFQEYLEAFPEDTLIRFHYASAYEKDKVYAKSIPEFRKILQNPAASEYHLAQYHYSHNLMQTHKDEDWYAARKQLKVLVKTLDNADNTKEKDLLKYARTLLKTALGPVIKPTRYKDIILTEGSYKKVDPMEVFSSEDIRFVNNPTSKSLLAKQKSYKPQVWMGLEYADDSEVTYNNYKIGVENLLLAGGVRYGMEVQNFTFEGLVKEYDGLGLFLQAQVDKWRFGLGVEHFDDFDVLVPKVSWSPIVGAHSLYMEAYYKNGAFINYRNCMIQNKTNVYHVGLYDSILMDNLNSMSLGLDINHFEDDNDNLYGQFTLPLLSTTLLGLEHSILFNENLEYNSNIKACSHPVEFYDTSYLKYQPKYQFRQGIMEASAGAGYSFNNKEIVYTYGLNAEYTIERFATLSVNCERLQSSFTADAMTFCRFNVIQDW